MNLQSQIESILFVASKPLAEKKIAKALDADLSVVQEALAALAAKYNGQDSGIHFLREGASVQLATDPANADVVSGFIKDEVSGDLTKAQLETLTVVAYRGPITRPELEQIRGVNCAVILRNLMVRGLVQEEADKDALMSSYRLSFDALRHLGIKNVSALPDYDVLHSHDHIDAHLAQSDA